jgi:dissimilatory sulfite reductase (desulfoviridin) alpha/beta subunit
MDAETLLQTTLERARSFQRLRSSAIEQYLQQIAEQIEYMERVGITSIHVTVPQFFNRIPLDREYTYKKVKKKLKKIGYRVVGYPDDYVLVISWFMV